MVLKTLVAVRCGGTPQSHRWAHNEKAQCCHWAFKHCIRQGSNLKPSVPKLSGFLSAVCFISVFVSVFVRGSTLKALFPGLVGVRLVYGWCTDSLLWVGLWYNSAG